MGGSWWARFTIIISVFACALYVLMPTLIGNDAKDRLKSQVVDLNRRKSLPWTFRELVRHLRRRFFLR